MRHHYQLAISLLFLTAGCNKLLGLDQYGVGSQTDAAVSSHCSKHSDCTQDPMLAGMGADYCSQKTHRCVALKSKDCTGLTGPATDDNAVLIGSLFATSGDQAAANVARERSAILAVSEINAIGGLPPAKGSDQRRPLAMLSCDASTDPLRAAEHLVDDLGVPAIVGPNNSQNTLDIAMKVTIRGGTVTLSPQAVAGSIAELIDDDLTWQMVPSDAQRGPLMVHELATLERDLRAVRGRDELKLSIIVRNDALGTGTRASLNGMKWNGESLANALNFGAAKIDPYEGSRSAQTDLVAAHAAFAPDLVVLVGSGDAVNEIMAPLEQRWGSGPRPEYVLIDSSKVPDLLALVDKQPDLAPRVRGTGTTPGTQSTPIYQDFLINYTTRYPEYDEASSAGVGPSYDATYAIAYGIVAADGDVTGHNIARGLRRLSSGEVVELGPPHILGAFRRLGSGESITAIGTYSALVWDDRGALSSGTVEIWCVKSYDGRAVFESSGITADVPSQALHGDNTVCPVRAVPAERAAPQPTSDADAGVPSRAQAGKPNGKPDSDAGTPGAADSGTSTPDEPGSKDDASRDAGTAAASEPPQPVPCGTTECDRTQGEYCCVSTLRPNGMPAVDFSCRSQAQPQPCALSLPCTSDRECARGAICCGDARGTTHCLAAISCGYSERHLGCDQPSDCNDGKICCAHGDPVSGLFEAECQTSCESGGGPDLAARVCNAQSQCNRPLMCVRTESLPTVAVCR